ncbi:MAG: universal stress protein [Chloroflexi bacterium]|nr:universal stress protein [Chloroflexota bacterium]
MFKRILVPLDGSLLSQQSLPYAKYIARCGEQAAELVLLRVTSQPTGVMLTPEDVAAVLGERRHPLGSSPYQPTLGDRMFIPDAPPHADPRIEHEVEQAAVELDALQVQLLSEGFVVRTILQPGVIAETVLDVAQQEAVDMIAMTTHGRGGLGRFVLGSVADRVTRHAEVPVLLVRAQDVVRETPKLKHILVPLDGSELAAAVLPKVQEIAQACAAEILLLRVAPGERGYMAEPMPILQPTLLHGEMFEPMHASDVYQQQVANEYIENTGASVQHRGVPTRTLVLLGDPATIILDVARDEHVDIIAMSTHGRSGLRRFLLGSVSERVVRHSDVPVLLFRAR